MFSTGRARFNENSTTASPTEVAVEEAAAPAETVQTYGSGSAVVDKILKIKTVDELSAQSPSSVPKDLADQMNAEFDSLLTDFVLNARIDTTTTEDKSSTPKLKKKAAKAGNIYGNERFPNLHPTGTTEPYSSQELYLRREHQARVLGGLGSSIENVYKPHEDVLKPPSISQTTLSTLLAAGAHLGHSVSRFRPTTQPYIYGIREGIHIIDLEQTLVHLRRAAKVIESVAEQGGIIVYVGTRPGQQRSVEVAANRSGGYYVHRRWVPGTLSNSRDISQRWERMEVNMGDEPTGRVLAPHLRQSIVKPDLVVILNPIENRHALNECGRNNVPTIGIVDTDSEPSLITYPIPGNDDSIRATDIIVGVLSKAAEKGYKRRLAGYNKYAAQLKKDFPADAADASASAPASPSAFDLGAAPASAPASA